LIYSLEQLGLSSHGKGRFQCFWSLLSNACLDSQQDPSRSIDLFDEEDLEGMMLNVLMANRQSVAPAA
jgi:hypothetical protein